jgi:phosphoribosyl 1,2-cyclic phosphodiesterase
MRFCLLASGSRGNCVWVESGGRALLVDSGLSMAELGRRAAAAGLDPARAEAVVVTHEHSDHVGGVGPLARRLRIPVYATAGCARAAGSRLEGLPRLEIFEAGRTIDLGFLSVRTVPSSHDAADPVVMAIRSGASGRALGLATDLGAATGLVREALKGADALIVEFNHDLRMLIDGPYPYWLKQRVRSRRGHLSNEQGAELVASLAHPGLARVVLAHLSENNNTQELALAAARAALGPDGPPVAAAGQWAPTEVFSL